MLYSTRRLAAILFADITGYTAMMQHDEQEALEKLALFKQILETQTTEFQGQIIQYYGDGCLALFNSPSEAVACAQALQNSFQQVNLAVRIGIHLGDVVFREGNALGDAVNIASRIESLGVPGAVLLSQSVRQQVKNHPEFQLASLGNFDFKNVDEPMEVFALANEGFPVPKREEMAGKLKSPVVGTALISKAWQKWAWAAGIALAALAGWLILKKTGGGQVAPVAGTEKSIALLPFRNESADTLETQYFCNGVMESILNNLSQIGELHVISRQSIEQYRGSRKAVAEIAQELNVAYLLEGSVQRAGNRMKINAQLIYAASDRHLWAEEFVGELDDIFDLQNKIAKSVADAMQATIAPAEIQRIERTPTSNMEAWNTYLEAHASFANYIYSSFNNYGFGTFGNDENYLHTLRLCDLALTMDSTLAEAWTLKAQAWWSRNFSREFLAENFMDSVAWFAKKALVSDHQSALAYSLLGRYYLNTGEPDMGREYLEKAVELNPNQVESLWYLGNYYRDAGNYEEAMSAYKTALELAPNSFWSPLVFIDISYLCLSIGDIEQSVKFLEKVNAISKTTFTQNRVFERLVWIYTLQGNFEKAIEIAYEVMKTDTIAGLNRIIGLYGFTGDFKKEINIFQKLETIAPHSIRPNELHRYAYSLWKNGDKKAGLKMFKKAEDQWSKAQKLGRTSFDYDYDLSGIYAFQGQKEKAWKYLRAFDKKGLWPGGLHYFIQVDPLFDSLRNDQEFKEMLQRVLTEKAQLREQMQAWEVKVR